MSPQIILKMYQEKIAEQEKSRKDKEKRIRKLHREEDKMIELNKIKSNKKIFIEGRDKNKTQYNNFPRKTKSLLNTKTKSLSNNLININIDENQIDDYETYIIKKTNYEKNLEIHRKKEKSKIERIELEEEKIELPYKSMYDFFDKKRFFMGLDRLSPNLINRKIEQKKK